jgi:hypothetical protein
MCSVHRLLLVAHLLLVIAFSSPAGAASKAKQCKVECGALIATCAARNHDLGNFQHVCRAAVLKRCRKQGPGVCLTTTTTTSTTIMPSTTTASVPSTTTTTTTLRFVDNANGTVTDHQTGLIWEKKDHTCPGIHCVTDLYTWSSTGNGPDGTAFTSFLATLNGGVTGIGNCVQDGISPMGVIGGFVGHCDWRLPTVLELQTILLAPELCGTSPCIDSIFGPTATSSETNYWSSTAVAGHPEAWVVDFGSGRIFFRFYDTGFSSPVRAVRGGSE